MLMDRMEIHLLIGMDAFHSNKYFEFKFRVFHVTNGTVFSRSLDYQTRLRSPRFNFCAKIRRQTADPLPF